jgi:hypothetical protein
MLLPYKSTNITTHTHETTPNIASTAIEGFHIDKATAKRYIAAYFSIATSTACVFLHQPTIMVEWAQSQIDQDVLALLCSMGLLLTSQSQQESQLAKNWVENIQLRILARIGAQTFEHLRTLILLVQFHYLAGNVSETWNIVPLAARLAFTLRLNYESCGIEPIAQETQRRSLWAIYFVDRMLSGGVEELTVCPIELMYMRLPCDGQTFYSGLPSRAGYLDGREGEDPFGIDLVAYHIKLKATRDRILRYVLGFLTYKICHIVDRLKEMKIYQTHTP